MGFTLQSKTQHSRKTNPRHSSTNTSTHTDTGSQPFRLIGGGRGFHLQIEALNHQGEPLDFIKGYRCTFKSIEEAVAAFRDLDPCMAAELVGIGKAHLESRILHVTLDKGEERLAERHYDFCAFSEFEAIIASLMDLGYTEDLFQGLSLFLPPNPTESETESWFVECEGYPNFGAYGQARTAIVQPMTVLTTESERVISIACSPDYTWRYDYYIDAWHQQCGTLQAAWLMSDLIHRKEGLLPFPNLADLARGEGVSDEDLALMLEVSIDQARSWLDGSDRPNKEERDGIATLFGTDQLTIQRAVFMGRVEAREYEDEE